MWDRQPGGRRAAAVEALGLALILATILGSTAVVALAYRRARPIKVMPPPPVVVAPSPPPKPLGPPPMPAEDPTPAAVAAVDRDRAEAEQARADAEAKTAATREALRSKRAANEAIKRRAALAKSQLDALETKAAAIEEQADEYARERDVLAAERDANRRELDTAKLRAGAASSYAIAPYKGANGTWRKPIVLDCRDGGVTLLPDGPTFGVLELSGELGIRRNPLVATIVLAVAKSRNEVGPDGSPVVPFVMFLIRPDGIRPYYEARNLLERLGVAFGYELADQDWDVEVAEEGPSALASRSMGEAGGFTTGRAARRGVILEPPVDLGGGLRSGAPTAELREGIRSIADHVGSSQQGGIKGAGTEPTSPGGRGTRSGLGSGGTGQLASDATAIGSLAQGDPSLHAFDGGEPGKPDGGADERQARRGDLGSGLGDGVAGDPSPSTGRGGLPEFSPTPPSSVLDAGTVTRGHPTTSASTTPQPGGVGPGRVGAGKPNDNAPSRSGAGAASPDGVETGLPSMPETDPTAQPELKLPEGFKPLPEPPQSGTWERTSPPAPGGETPLIRPEDREPPSPGGRPSTGAGVSPRPLQRGKPAAGGSGLATDADASQGTPVAGSYAGKRPDRNLLLTVACGPNGVVVQPGNHKIGKVKLAGPGDPVLRCLRTLAADHQAANPGVTVRPEVRFLVELGGEDSYMKARRQTILAGLGWPTSLRVADGSVRVGLGGDR